MAIDNVSDLSSETLSNNSTITISKITKTIGDDGSIINKTTDSQGNDGQIKKYHLPPWHKIDESDILSSWYYTVYDYVSNNRAEAI